MLYTPHLSKNNEGYVPNTPSSTTSNNINTSLGITLIELMVAIAITLILTMISLPSLNDYLIQLRVNNEIYHLSRLLLTARNHAINSGYKVIICPLKTNGECSLEWHKQLFVFIDSNNNKQFDGIDNEQLIATKDAIKQGDLLQYAMTRNKITYQPTGHLFGLSNGTLKYCPKNNKQKSRGIVISQSGRFYPTADSNNDGQDETRNNKIIVCNEP